MYIVNYSIYKNDPDLDSQVMVVCGDRNPTHAYWIVTKFFSSKEEMLDFVISYIKELELFSDFSSDEEYLDLKKQFGKFYHINEDDSWSDRHLSLEEKEEFVQTVFDYYGNDDIPWFLQLAIGKITENEFTELYKS